MLEEKEELLRTFCTNAEVNKMTLKLNFKTVYAGKDILLALDAPKKTAYFLGSTDHRLMLTNYYRDVMPKLAEVLRMSVGGSTSRLTAGGWQSLHDVINDINFKADFAEVDKVEVMSTVASVRWRKPTLELGVNLLNFQGCSQRSGGDSPRNQGLLARSSAPTPAPAPRLRVRPLLSLQPRLRSCRCATG